MDLFSFHDEGVGFPFFHPKGKAVLNVMTEYMRGLQGKHGYQEISTPLMLSDELWKRSGHYAHYKDKMYFCNVDEQSYAVKPMNCPGSILVYKSRPRSYRELPLKLAEYGHVFRHELSGVLHGLLRVRAFTQDDAHIYCMPDTIEDEVIVIMKMIYEMLEKFGFKDIDVTISTKPENAMGSPELWEKATNALKNALQKMGKPFTISEGEGAFYGPKIEFRIKDSMGREWQCSTVQVDFFQPENFDLNYIANTGEKERPVMIHQAIYGSLERFFAIILEHYKGHLPFWLAPIQMRVLTITDAQKEYATNIKNKLEHEGFRVEQDLSSDPISGQIKSAQLDKVPWMIVIGKKEVENSTLTLRYADGKQEFGLTLDALIDKAKEQNK
jgi:threonyl-tRNA synthetase